MKHILKTDPAVFQAVVVGAKTYEIRFNDRGFAVGDVLLLRETTHTGAEIAAGAALDYTGREITKTVSHVLAGYGLGEGWVNLSFAGAPSAGPAPAAEAKPLTRYGLHTVTHERRIKPMPDGRYYLASDADQREAAATAEAREAGRQDALRQVGALFGIGRDARNLGGIETNVQNLVRRVECLGAIEREFFMVPAEQDEDAPGIEPGEKCLLNWGAAPADYVEQFRSALANQFGHLAVLVGPTEAWGTLDDNGQMFHTTAFSTEAAQHAQKGRKLVTLMRRPVETKAAAAINARKLPSDLAQAICRIARDRGHGLAIGPVRDFLEAQGQPQAATICTRELELGDFVEVLPGCQSGEEDFSGRRGVVRGFEMDGMTGVHVEFLDGGAVFATRSDLEFLSSAPTDPLMMPLPCDIKVGNVVHRKGATLLSLVARMHSLYALADAAGAKSFRYDAEHPDDGLNAPGAARAPGAAELALHLALAHAEQVLPAGHCISIEVQRGRSVVDWDGPSGLVYMNACGSLTAAVREATRAALESKT